MFSTRKLGLAAVMGTLVVALAAAQSCTVDTDCTRGEGGHCMVPGTAEDGCFYASGNCSAGFYLGYPGRCESCPVGLTSEGGYTCSGDCHKFCYQACENGDKCYTPTGGSATCVNVLGQGQTACMQTCTDNTHSVMYGNTGYAYCTAPAPPAAAAAPISARQVGRKRTVINFEEDSPRVL